MSNAKRMDVGQSSTHLVSIELNEEIGNILLLLIVVFHYSVDGLRDVVHYYIKIKLILLRIRSSIPWFLWYRKRVSF